MKQLVFRYRSNNARKHFDWLRALCGKVVILRHSTSQAGHVFFLFSTISSLQDSLSWMLASR